MNWITNSIINCLMRKTNMLLWATSFVCVALVSGCAKVNTGDPTEENVPSENIVVLQATANENDTKAELALDGGAFSWNTTDRIAVATSAGYKASTSEAVVSGADASFSVDLGGATLNTNAFALYPHTLVMNAAGTASLEDCDISHDGDGDVLVVHLPATYAIDDVTSPKVPCPMIASNVAEGTMLFKQLCTILCVKVNSVPSSAKSLVFDFNGKKVSGRFEIAANPTPGTSSIVADDNDSFDTITVTGLNNADWTDGLIINLPIPTGVASTNEFTTVKVTAKNSSSETVLEMTRPIKVGENWVPARATRRKIVASLPAFSVGNSKRVHIAKSNLQLSRPDMLQTWAYYQAQGLLTWSFMPKSWSRETDTDIEVDYANKTAVRSFSWGTSGHNFNAGKDPEEYVYGTYYQPWNTPDGDENINDEVRLGSDFGPKGTNLNLTGTFAYGDWGRKICGEDDTALDDHSGYGFSKDWRLLTGPEAQFLFGKVRKPNDKYTDPGDAEPGDGGIYTKRFHNWGFGYINTDAEDEADRVSGLIILPDYFVDPSGIFVKANRDATTSTTANRFTEDQWALMEAAGAAFLPSSIRILRKQNNETGVQCGLGIFAWTSTGRGEGNTTHASFINVSGNYNNAKLYPYDETANRRNGLPVRLIRDLN